MIALLFFSSLLAHELSHSLVSKHLGIDVKKISLFILGGIAQIEKEPEDARDEFKIAVAGPLMSIFLFLAFGGLYKLFVSLNTSEVLTASSLYLSQANLIVAVFNLLPAFPLDGGRILRSIIWLITKDIGTATKVSSFLGTVFAYFLISLGVLGIISGNLVNGIWLIFIGWFLNQQSRGSYENMVIKNVFKDVRLRELMSKDVVTVKSDMTVEDVIEDYFYKYNFVSFPVIEDEEVVGIIALDLLKTVTKKERSEKTVREIMIPLNENLSVTEDENITDAMDKIFRNNVGRVLVLKDNRLLGIVSRSDILKYIKIHSKTN